MLIAKPEDPGNLIGALRSNHKIRIPKDLGCVSSIAISLGWRGRNPITRNFHQPFKNINHKYPEITSISSQGNNIKISCHNNNDNTSITLTYIVGVNLNSIIYYLIYKNNAYLLK
ncbi:MAG: hypothetical protein CG437_735 [Methanosaeta sp. NSP1]|nr:MAG: hypothetical protein CG437_735 [Methanosaeta sp. NSP1]